MPKFEHELPKAVMTTVEAAGDEGSYEDEIVLATETVLTYLLERARQEGQMSVRTFITKIQVELELS
jgi:hypothetical protein